MKTLLILCTTLLIAVLALGQACGVKNIAINNGETVTLKVFYSASGMNAAAGTAKFTAKTTSLNGKPVFHCVGEGKTYSFFDNFFKVRDKYETYLDTNTLLPQKFVRNVQEGKYKKYNNVTFNQSTNTAVSTSGVFKVTKCIQDVMSMSYYARNLDFSKMKVGDKIPFTIFLDDESFSIYIKYMGKEVVKTSYGKFNSIRLKPLLIKGDVFDGGEKMNVWVSDDPNRIILRVDSPISVGSVKIDMIEYSGLKYKLTSLISKAE